MPGKQKTKFSLDDYSMSSSQVDGMNESLPAPSPHREQSRRGKRVENIPVTKIFPDRQQPRPQLPFSIAEQFYEGSIDCFEAMRQWLNLAEENPVFYTRLRKLTILQDSLDESGLIKPATGTWLRTKDGADFFFLETGERRFWAIVLDAIQKGDTGEHITLECINQANPSRKRQAEENEKVEPLTAVGRAREIAGLLLDLSGIQPDPNIAYGPNEYHRLISRYKFPEEMWAEVTKITGLKRSRMVQYLQILDLSDDILELADAYDIPSKFLYQVVRLPYEKARDRLIEIVNSYAGKEEQLSHEDILELTQSQVSEGDDVVSPGAKGVRPYHKVDPSIRAARRLKGILVGLYDRTSRTSHDPIGSIASSLFVELEDSEQISAVANRLEDLAKQLRLRLDSSQR